MAIKDSEDIVNLLKEYISEDVGNGQARINDIIDKVNAEKGQSDPNTALLPRVSNNINDIKLGQRLQEVQTNKNGYLVINIVFESKFDPRYNKVAKEYTATIGYVIRSDGSKNIFLRGLRMERVLTDLFETFLEEKQQAGFINGRIEGAFIPKRDLLGNSEYNTLISGIIYKFNLF